MIPSRSVALALCSLLAVAGIVVWPSSGHATVGDTTTTTRATEPVSDGGGDVFDNANSGQEPAVGAHVTVFGPGDGTTAVVSTGSSVFAGCTWDRVEQGEELVIGRPDIAAINLTGSTFAEPHYIVFCPHLSATDLTGLLAAYTIFPVGGPLPTDVTEQLIADAYARTPVVAFNPITSPDGDEDIMLITRMTTFLWVDETAWNAPVSATASLVFPTETYSVTTTARAAIANWSGGDEPATCTGDQMHPYVFGIGGDENQPSDCTMVYLRSSALQDNIVEVEAIWDVSYACNFPNCGGVLPDISVTSTRPVTVGEILAVETPTTP